MATLEIEEEHVPFIRRQESHSEPHHVHHQHHQHIAENIEYFLATHHTLRRVVMSLCTLSTLCCIAAVVILSVVYVRNDSASSGDPFFQSMESSDWCSKANSDVNNFRPIVGILSQPSSDVLSPFGDEYIAASYVKWIQGAGARVAPVFYTSDEDEMRYMLGGLSGLVLPGGDSCTSSNSTFYKAAKRVIDLAIEMNDNNDFFPVWGTCQGFELLNLVVSEDPQVLTNFVAQDFPIPLELTNAAKKSCLFSTMPLDVWNSLRKSHLTLNNHDWGVSPDYYKHNSIGEYFDILSINTDRHGSPFISTIEAHKTPVYGVQWHPEKNIYEWAVMEEWMHTLEAIKVAQYFGDFFVQQCRHCAHVFSNAKIEKDLVIENWNPVFTHKLVGSSFDEAYVWPADEVETIRKKVFASINRHHKRHGVNE